MTTRLFVDGLFTALKAGFVPPSGGGTTTFLRADGTWATAGIGSSGVPTTRVITTTTPLKINGTTSADLSVDPTLSIIAFTTALMGAVNASSSAANFLRGDNTWSTIAQVTAALNLFSSTLQGLVPASGGGVLNFLRADGTWAAPPLERYDTVIDMTGTPISFGAAYDAWNVGTLGQNTLIQYITDGTPTGSSTRSLRGVAGGSYGKTIALMNMSNFTGVANLTHETGTAGSAFHNASLGTVGGGGTGGVVTYWYDGTLWRETGTT